jgi:hypothetical protein
MTLALVFIAGLIAGVCLTLVAALLAVLALPEEDRTYIKRLR